MRNMIQSIIDVLLTLVREIGYPGVALAMMIESFFAPIPSEAIMPLAGFLASQGTMNLWILALVGGIASYIGTLPFYVLGYRGNRQKINKRLDRYGKYLFIKASEIDEAFSRFHRYGKSLVFFGRLIPIIRTVISFPAGCVKMAFWEFSLYTIAGSVLRSGFLAWAGYMLGEHWESVGGAIGKYEHLVLVLGVIGVVAYLTYLFGQRKKK